MLKLLLMIAVLGVAAWFWIGRRRPPRVPPAANAKAAPGAAPQTMLACAHCGVHLPQVDALFDVGGKPYCSEAHRLQGPR